MTRLPARISFVAVLALWLFAPHPARAATLTLYSRLSFAPAVTQAFTTKTGIKIRLRRPPASGLQSRIIAEGDHPVWSLAWFDGAATATILDHHGLLAHHLPNPPDLTPLGQSLTSADGAYVPTGVTLAGVLVAPKAAPFAPPGTWDALNDPAYHGIIGMNDPATSEQSFATLANMLHAAGGWTAGQPYVEALKRNGLHIYTETKITLAALRSGAIQLAIVRSAAAFHYATDIDPSLRVIIPQPTAIMPSVIVMAKGLTGTRRADAEKFIAYVNTATALKIGMTQGGIDADFWPVTTSTPPPAALPSLTSLSPHVLDPAQWGTSRHAIIAWYATEIVGPST
ncbi:MAG: extracellular solute-binding protein [Acidiphilium sp.]|nr:extracellular solute-binding protein [Acidiphilium sp.]MDD4934445.1 extracellular solute-binding protein [Acidiphilium sp.]